MTQQLMEEVLQKLGDPTSCSAAHRSLYSALSQGTLVMEDLRNFRELPSLIRICCRTSLTEQVKGEECTEYAEEDFVTTRERLLLVTPFLAQVVNHVKLRGQTLLLDVAASDIVILASMNYFKQAWNTQGIVDQLTQIINNLKCVLGYVSLQELLQHKAKHSNTQIADDMAGYIRAHLQRIQWKTWPGAQASFLWFLNELLFPYMSDYIDTVVPAALLFTDDHVLENKITGVNSLQKIITHTGKTELTWHDRAYVIYQALYHLTYTRENSLVVALYPTLLSILDVIERYPPFEAQMKISRHDLVFERMLDEMYAEDKIMLRLAYSALLPRFIDRFGIYTVRHLKKLVLIVKSYLEISDAPDEAVRINILQAVQHIIREAWPRMATAVRAGEMLADLTKLLVDVFTDPAMPAYSSGTDPSASLTGGSGRLVDEAVRCLALLARCSPTAAAAIGELVTASAVGGSVFLTDCFRRSIAATTVAVAKNGRCEV